MFYLVGIVIDIKKSGFSEYSFIVRGLFFVEIDFALWSIKRC